ncbi:hypothetical protein HHI36_009036 [Cryptolaemus montrouzieri]|uniref:protein-serine/threonine phosphatase n=1 Tax=Cryptolaemus montrouzieri TaxID=559131 RepID=A0ABD2MV21_9CUCU
MGSYASEPKVDKESLDEYNDRLNCGASSMQGWRVSQEDAHNCLLDFDTNTSFFAVYDGHGGHEVAHYCSQKLPEYIKNTNAYKEGNIETALEEGFLGFDQTITTPEVIAVLKEIAEVEDDEEDGDDVENVENLYEEAAMPIEQVIEKYTSNLVNPAIMNLKKGEKAPKSPYLKAKKENGTDEAPSSSDIESKTSSSTEEAGTSSTISNDASSSSNEGEKAVDNQECDSSKSDEKPNDDKQKIPEIKISVMDDKVEAENEVSPQKGSAEIKKTETLSNGDISQEKVSETDIQENGEATPKGKGKAKMKRLTPVAVRVSPRTKQSPNLLYKKLLDFGGCEEEDSEDEEDITFEAEENSSDDEENVTNSHLEEGSEDSSIEEEEDDDSLENDDEDDDDMEFTNNMKVGPGSDSGCTAVVAVLKDEKLWVANAGDSRCVVCRKGKAIEMSFDHKPEDEPERNRIVKAGGRVTMDGRVNNGLNLSRAIGDHAYKLNTELGPREQMITALPDIKTLELNLEEDEFMILACDGIWNFMSSQEVVDFIRPKIQENREKLSSICEELFDHCLAPNTMGDGTGCDNMTAIIIQFKPNKKRPASPEKTDDSHKRVKTDIESENKV